MKLWEGMIALDFRNPVSLAVPRGAAFFAVSFRNWHVYLAAEIDPDASLVLRRFWLFRTGATLPEAPSLHHLGSVRVPAPWMTDAYSVHVYTDRKEHPLDSSFGTPGTPHADPTAWDPDDLMAARGCRGLRAYLVSRRWIGENRSRETAAAEAHRKKCAECDRWIRDVQDRLRALKEAP